MEQENQPKVSYSKAERLTVAITIGAVLLLVILLFVMIFQMIKIGKAKSEYEYLQGEIAKYQQLIENGEMTLEARKSYDYLYYRALEMGYVVDGDKIYKLNEK